MLFLCGLHEALEHGRNAHEEGHGMTLVRLERQMDIELGENQLGRRKANSSAHQEGQPISVEVGEQ